MKGALLQSGAYDLPRLYRETSNSWLRKLLNPSGAADPKLQNLLNETASWPGATLILHGGQDSIIPPSQANLLDARLKSLGKLHRLVLYPESGHRLRLNEIRSEAIHFLKETGGSACSANVP